MIRIILYYDLMSELLVHCYSQIVHSSYIIKMLEDSGILFSIHREKYHGNEKEKGRKQQEEVTHKTREGVLHLPCVFLNLTFLISSLLLLSNNQFLVEKDGWDDRAPDAHVLKSGFYYATGKHIF